MYYDELSYLLNRRNVFKHAKENNKKIQEGNQMNMIF